MIAATVAQTALQKLDHTDPEILAQRLKQWWRQPTNKLMVSQHATTFAMYYHLRKAHHISHEQNLVTRFEHAASAGAYAGAISATCLYPFCAPFAPAPLVHHPTVFVMHTLHAAVYRAVQFGCYEATKFAMLHDYNQHTIFTSVVVAALVTSVTHLITFPLHMIKEHYWQHGNWHLVTNLWQQHLSRRVFGKGILQGIITLTLFDEFLKNEKL